MDTNETIEQTFVPRQVLDPAILQELFVALVDRPNVEETAEITLFYGPPDNYSRRFEGKEEWKSVVASDWAQIVEASMYDYGDPATVMIRADLRRNQITVRSILSEGQDVAAWRSALESAGNMIPLTHDVYRYRRAAVVYRAESWSLEDFANALEEVIDDLTGPLKPIVREAYLTYEHSDAPIVERLKGYFDTGMFIDSLRSQDIRVRKVREIFFSIEGPSRVILNKPWGCGFGIHVSLDSGPPRLTFLSSLEASDLEDSIKPFRRAVGLGKPIKAHSLGSSSSAEAVKLEERFPIKNVVLPIVAALIALFTWQGIGIIFPDYTLEISAPVYNGEEFSMAPGILELRWFLKPDQRIVRDRRFDVPALAEVFQNGKKVQEQAGRSSVFLPLDAGKFTIIITADLNVADPASIEIKVGRD